MTVSRPGFSGRPSESGSLFDGIASDAVAGCAQAHRVGGLLERDLLRLDDFGRAAGDERRENVFFLNAA